MNRLLIKMTSAILFCLAHAGNSSEWVNLFDGKSLAGWVQRGGKAKYRVEQAQVIGTSVAGTGNSFLCTTRDYTNFLLELEFKTAPGLNSGVQIRSHSFVGATEFAHNGKLVKISPGRVHGYQVEIDPSQRAWTGGVFDESRRGWLNDLKSN